MTIVTANNEESKAPDYKAGGFCTGSEGVSGWVEETKEMRWADLQKLPFNLGEKILENLISDYEFIKGWEMTKEEAIAMIEAKPIEAECTVYGIHGQKVSLSFNNPQCLFWNIYDLKYFESVFKKEVSKQDEVPDVIYVCNSCDEMHHDETDVCEQCPSQSVRVVSKGDLGFF